MKKKFKKLSELDREELVAKIEDLRKHNKDLRDESDSLWMMLDEMAQSDIENWRHLLDQLEAEVAEKTLMVTRKKADC